MVHAIGLNIVLAQYSRTWTPGLHGEGAQNTMDFKNMIGNTKE